MHNRRDRARTALGTHCLASPWAQMHLQESVKAMGWAVGLHPLVWLSGKCGSNKDGGGILPSSPQAQMGLWKGMSRTMLAVGSRCRISSANKLIGGARCPPTFHLAFLHLLARRNTQSSWGGPHGCGHGGGCSWRWMRLLPSSRSSTPGVKGVGVLL